MKSASLLLLLFSLAAVSVAARPAFVQQLDAVVATTAAAPAPAPTAAAASGGATPAAAASSASSAPTTNNATASGNSTSANNTGILNRDFGPWPVPQWFLPPVVRRLFLIGSGLFLAAVLFTVYMTQSATRMQEFHWYALVIVIAITVCYLMAWLSDGSSALVFGDWPLDSPRIVTWVRYADLCIVAPLFILCITSISHCNHLAAAPATAYCLLYVVLSIGAFTVHLIKFFIILPLAAGLWCITAYHLREIVRRAFHILPGWRADLTLTLTAITLGSAVAYIALWIVGPEGLFLMYLSHITLLTLAVDCMSHVGFVGFILSDGERLEAASAADPLLQQARNKEFDKPVTVEGLPQRRSELV